MANDTLSSFGLHNEIESWFKCKQAAKGFFEKRQEAANAYEENERSIKAIQIKLGKHTQQMKNPEIVLFQDMAAYVPVPPVGYTDFPVEIVLTVPKGFPVKKKK